MKASDICVGDWVNYSILNLKANVFSILGNHTIGIQFVDKNNKVEAIHGLLEETINPIPLTEEILVKNRFALDKSLAEIGMKVYTRPCPAGDLSVKVFHDGSIRFGFIKLTYIHQLQHLLRLCGIENEVQL